MSLHEWLTLGGVLLLLSFVLIGFLLFLGRNNRHKGKR